MKLTRHTMSDFRDDMRTVLGKYDMELVVNDGLWLLRADHADAYMLYMVPFTDHKPFYKGQK